MHKSTFDLTGKRFVLWTVLAHAGSSKKGGALWLCRCDCGNEKVVSAENLRRGKSKSCGCMSQVWRTQKATKHGHTRFGGHMSSTYQTWHSMRQRCLNENVEQFADYGGRGITICDRWSDFRNFLADMGEKPKGTSLDRIDVNGNYEPENCRWATQEQQAVNKRPRVRHSDVQELIAAARVIIAANDNEVPAALSAMRAALDKLDNRIAA